MARRRAWRAVKWVGVIACAALSAAWGVSWGGRLGPVRRHGADGRTWIAGCGRGVLVIGAAPGLHFSGLRWFEPLADGGAGDVVWWPRWYSGTDGRGVWFPLWAPLAAAGALTAWAWRRDRRLRPGRCACGYDLSGLGARAVCPECGRELGGAELPV